MTTGKRVLLACAGAVVGAFVGLVVEWLSLVVLTLSCAGGKQVEGTGLVIVALAPFAAAIGAAMGVWWTLRRTRRS